MSSSVFCWDSPPALQSITATPGFFCTCLSSSLCRVWGCIIQVSLPGLTVTGIEVTQRKIGLIWIWNITVISFDPKALNGFWVFFSIGEGSLFFLACFFCCSAAFYAFFCSFPWCVAHWWNRTYPVTSDQCRIRPLILCLERSPSGSLLLFEAS